MHKSVGRQCRYWFLGIAFIHDKNYMQKMVHITQHNVIQIALMFDEVKYVTFAHVEKNV